MAGFALAVWIVFRITHRDLLPDAPITGRWSVFDWLTNYEGGFVRRGFLGEAILRLTGLTGIAPTDLVFGGMLAAYGAQAALMYGLFRAVPNPTPALLILFAPFMLGFGILTSSAIGRKDVLFLVLIAAVAFSHARGKPGAPNHAPDIALAILPALVLTHEAFFLFSPYLLALALIDARSPSRLARVAALWALSAIAFVAVVLNHGTAHTVEGICRSLERHVSAPGFSQACPGGGAIASLQMNAAHGWAHFQKTYADQTVLTATPAILLIAVAFVPMAGFLGQMKVHSRRTFLVVGGSTLAAMAMSLPLFVIADDWGRWLHIHAVALGLLLTALLARGQTEGWAAPGPLATRMLGGGGYLVLAAFYATMWNLNIVGGLIGGGFAGSVLGLAI